MSVFGVDKRFQELCIELALLDFPYAVQWILSYNVCVRVCKLAHVIMINKKIPEIWRILPIKQYNYFSIYSDYFQRIHYRHVYVDNLFIAFPLSPSSYPSLPLSELVMSHTAKPPQLFCNFARILARSFPLIKHFLHNYSQVLFPANPAATDHSLISLAQSFNFLHFPHSGFTHPNIPVHKRVIFHWRVFAAARV